METTGTTCHVSGHYKICASKFMKRFSLTYNFFIWLIHYYPLAISVLWVRGYSNFVHLIRNHWHSLSLIFFKYFGFLKKRIIGNHKNHRQLFKNPIARRLLIILIWLVHIKRSFLLHFKILCLIVWAGFGAG